MTIPRLPVLAGLMLLPMPCWAADVPTKETELHIEASGSVTADFAIYTAAYIVGEHGKADCDAAVRESITRTKARLVAAGLPASAVMLTPSACEPAGDVDGPPNGFGFYQAMRKAGVGIPTIQSVELPDNAQGSTSEASNAAAAAANAAAKKARIEAERARMSIPMFIAKVAVSARVDDVSKVPTVQRVFNFQYGQPTAHTEYQFNHPGDVQAAALSSALSKARKEGDLFANNLGFHIVRIARVSNHAGSPSLADILNLFGQMKGQELEWTILASRSVSVAIDYVMAPN